MRSVGPCLVNQTTIVGHSDSAFCSLDLDRLVPLVLIDRLRLTEARTAWWAVRAIIMGSASPATACFLRCNAASQVDKSMWAALARARNSVLAGGKDDMRKGRDSIAKSNSIGPDYQRVTALWRWADSDAPLHTRCAVRSAMHRAEVRRVSNYDTTSLDIAVKTTATATIGHAYEDIAQRRTLQACLMRRYFTAHSPACTVRWTTMGQRLTRIRHLLDTHSLADNKTICLHGTTS
ncbi:uncharacterized protein C8Q71DRAFT_291824 [Rhodofomes roseus]|uniref:Uncharacterized protein n=1 Tax=Rhodofomes roseus TaxID=34475 RepID=A0ABQ8K4F2_9APHY|nr:uncharacterized protein C8Q71DRAFT_291824 [Rhodofomes roseus]KAH9831559.1 hypothetical protein C8Q71DRAFT_291824 [Rhodofomes roseus]